jgi:hypothetical protein
MKKAIDYLLQCGVKTIKLEAVPQISELHRKLGFVNEYDSLRFIRTTSKSHPQKRGSPALIKEAKISEIGELDKKYLGADRTKVLASLLKDNPSARTQKRKSTRSIWHRRTDERLRRHVQKQDCLSARRRQVKHLSHVRTEKGVTERSTSDKIRAKSDSDE